MSLHSSHMQFPFLPPSLFHFSTEPRHVRVHPYIFLIDHIYTSCIISLAEKNLLSISFLFFHTVIETEPRLPYAKALPFSTRLHQQPLLVCPFISAVHRSARSLTASSSSSHTSMFLPFPPSC